MASIKSLLTIVNWKWTEREVGHVGRPRYEDEHAESNNTKNTKKQHIFQQQQAVPAMGDGQEVANIFDDSKAYQPQEEEGEQFVSKVQNANE